MTLKEIAAIAHVSPASVSLVLNNKPGVSDAKRQEIQALLSVSFSVSCSLLLPCLQRGELGFPAHLFPQTPRTWYGEDSPEKAQ